MTTSNARPTAATASLRGSEHPTQLVNGVKWLYLNQEFTDLTIVGKDREWKVHKAVLCSQSTYFYKQCTGKFKEALESKITFEDEDPGALNAVLHYLYNCDYNANGNSQNDVPPTVLHVRVYALADKFLLTPLKTLSAKEFARCAETAWNTPEFAAAVKEIYNIIPEHDDTLKRYAIRVVKDHSPDLYDATHGFIEFRKIVRENVDFAADVTAALAFEIDPRFRTYKCPTQGQVFGVSTTGVSHFGCPCGCYVRKSLDWWEQHPV